MEANRMRMLVALTDLRQSALDRSGRLTQDREAAFTADTASKHRFQPEPLTQVGPIMRRDNGEDLVTITTKDPDCDCFSVIRNRG